ncbi:hypothetical protein [Gimesia chilikensis]|uniref:hypothetical protein n=1 Tax=Gimesia chilikensis TaxID=2605989 RepID=UPI0011ECA682|nr:hypothetical protein [Gimesia chilikensis]
MRHFCRHPQLSFLPLSYDLEDITTGAQFVQRLIEKSGEQKELRPLLKQCGDLVSDFVDAFSNKVESIDGSGGVPGVTFRKKVEQTDWEPLARKIMLSLEKAEQPLLFLFDELPEMLKKIAHSESDESATRFLSWFRTVRLNENDELRRHRFVVAGSTGLNYILDRRLRCPETLNDFNRLAVEPLETPDAASLCCKLAENEKLTISDDTVEHLLTCIGQPVPYFIQLFFSELAQRRKASDTEITQEMIDTIYQRRLMGPTCKRYFDQYRRRLEQYDADQEKAIVNILITVANAKNPATLPLLYEVYIEARGAEANEIEFNELLADLECDWYLEWNPLANTYSFFMNIMKDWWARWYHNTTVNSGFEMDK